MVWKQLPDHYLTNYLILVFTWSFLSFIMIIFNKYHTWSLSSKIIKGNLQSITWPLSSEIIKGNFQIHYLIVVVQQGVDGPLQAHERVFVLSHLGHAHTEHAPRRQREGGGLAWKKKEIRNNASLTISAKIQSPIKFEVFRSLVWMRHASLFMKIFSCENF